MVTIDQSINTCAMQSLKPLTFPCDASAIELVSLGIACGVSSLLFVWFLIKQVHRAPRGNDLMNNISDKIKSGAITFLKTEYFYISFYVVVVFAALLILYTLDPPSGFRTDGIKYAGCFLAGAGLSASSGWIGMMLATDANVRTTQAAAENGLPDALRVAFAGGAVMGFTVVGLGLLGLSLMYFFVTFGYADETLYQRLNWASDIMAGFGFGASSIAIFARVAGGIYTKAADVGADLVGKVEMDIPEDDHRNPAVIADNVGDNVGDVAGMGADLFESYVGSIIAALTLAESDAALLMLPIWIAGSGIVASMIGYFVVRTKEGASLRDLTVSLHKGVIASSILVVGFSAIIVAFTFQGRSSEGWRLFGCIVIGLVAGIIIGQVTEFFTSYEFWPTKSITKAGVTGPATVVIQGLGIGMISTVFPVITLVATILGCNALSGQYGIALSAVGMLSTLGITLATDSYGPVADNAGGIAEMAELPHSVRQTTDSLDALGNTTAATGKGFAIGSAVLTALSLLAAFTNSAFSKVADEEVEIKQINIGEPIVLAGVLIGAMLPYLFAALAMLSVQKAAGSIIIEVRRQFAEIPGLREGTASPDSDTCVAIASQAAIQEMILPGLYAILSPITVGFLIGPRCLTGLLGGAIASGMMLAIMMANAGGAWDNSKKYIEIEGACGGKGTETHKACVVGDTVGDPFKDTSGPALNILIKLMSLISLTLAPIMSSHPRDWEVWYYGLIPLAIMLVGTYAVYHFFWREVADITADPVSKKVVDGAPAPTTAASAAPASPTDAKAISLMQGEVEVDEDKA